MLDDLTGSEPCIPGQNQVQGFFGMLYGFGCQSPKQRQRSRELLSLFDHELHQVTECSKSSNRLESLTQRRRHDTSCFNCKACRQKPKKPSHPNFRICKTSTAIPKLLDTAGLPVGSLWKFGVGSRLSALSACMPRSSQVKPHELDLSRPRSEDIDLDHWT